MNYYKFEINGSNLDFTVKENGDSGEFQTMSIPMLVIPEFIESIKTQIDFGKESIDKSKKFNLKSCQHYTSDIFCNGIEVGCTAIYSDYEGNKQEYITIAICQYIDDDNIIVFSFFDNEAPEFIKDMQDIYNSWSNKQKEHPHD